MTECLVSPYLNLARPDPRLDPPDNMQKAVQTMQQFTDIAYSDQGTRRLGSPDTTAELASTVDVQRLQRVITRISSRDNWQVSFG